MRMDARFSPLGHAATGRVVQSVTAVHALKPLAVNAYQAQEAMMRAHHKVDGDAPENRDRGWRGVERRKANHRAIQQPMLLELRSGHDRRQQVQCDDELCTHIDTEA